ncbi:MAG: tetratricopeptide repeat protein [Candidatus Kariarchaeaceae archaeon]
MNDQLLLKLIDQCKFNDVLKKILKIEDLSIQHLYYAFTFAEQEKIEDCRTYLEKIDPNILPIKYKIMYNTILAELYIDLGKIGESREVLSKTFEIKELQYKRMRRWYGTCLYVHAIIEVMFKGNRNALQDVTSAKNLFIEANNDYLLAKAYLIEGQLYTYLRESDLAIDAYEQSLELTTKLNLDYRIPKIYFNLGNVYKVFCNYDTSIEYYKQAYSLPNQGINQALILISMVDVMIYTSRHEEVLHYAEEAIQFFKDTNDLDNLSQTYDQLGHLYHGLKDYEQANSWYEKSLEIQQGIGEIHNRTPYTLMFSGINHVKREDHVIALHFLHQARNLFQLDKREEELVIVDSYIQSITNQEKEEMGPHGIIFHHNTSNELSVSMQSLFNHSVTLEISKFHTVDRMLLYRYDNLVFLSNASNDTIKYFAQIVSDTFGLAFEYDYQLNSIMVEYKNIKFNYGDYEKSQRKLFAIFALMNNPFGHPDSKLWLLLYGNKFNIENNIRNFIDTYGSLFAQTSSNIDRFYILKFDINDQNEVMDIPILNNQYISSLLG